MSIIDKKGKIGGKLNIIDLIAILLIIAVVALLGYKLTSSQDGLAGEGQPVVYTVKVCGVQPEVYEYIQTQLPGQLMAASELLDGQVTKVEATPAEKDTFELGRNANLGITTVTPQDAGTYDLVFTIEATVKDNMTSELGTQEIRVGKTHIVKTATFELENGIILSCERPEAAPVADAAE